MEPGKPTRRVFGTDATLDFKQQLEYIEKSNSKLVTRVYSQIDSLPLEDLDKCSQILSRAQAVAMKGLHQEDPEPTEDQLARAIKK